jgi:tyrosyl-tRNA synthetase
VLTMPLLEGLDGVQKMSKSYGNYVGITEAPFDMYGKLMSISDELMWRYYELLTDVSMDDISRMKAEVQAGSAHPMKLKKDLAARIVADFHSTDEARQAGEDWARQFQKDETPENLELVAVKFDEVAAKSVDGTAVKLDKVLARAGMADSGSDAQRKIKAGAVRVDGAVQNEPVMKLAVPAELTIRVGRLMKRVAIS